MTSKMKNKKSINGKGENIKDNARNILQNKKL